MNKKSNSKPAGILIIAALMLLITIISATAFSLRDLIDTYAYMQPTSSITSTENCKTTANGCYCTYTTTNGYKSSGIVADTFCGLEQVYLYAEVCYDNTDCTKGGTCNTRTNTCNQYYAGQTLDTSTKVTDQESINRIETWLDQNMPTADDRALDHYYEAEAKQAPDGSIWDIVKSLAWYWWLLIAAIVYLILRPLLKMIPYIGRFLP